jgi:hypothetical protein
MLMSKKAVGRRLGLLLTLGAALLMACSGVVLAQSTTPTYQKTATNPATPSNTAKADSSSSLPSASPAASVSNGDFETGNFNGWTVVNQPGSGGDWFVYSGTTSPLVGAPIAAPPQGTFAATTAQPAPGSHVLYQDIALEPNAKHTLSFFLYYHNFAPGFATPDTLDRTVFPNQQYRVDVLKPSANPFSVDPNDVLARIFRTEVGDPTTLDPTTKTFDLTPFAGQTVRLRFAEVDNEGPFLASTDDVKVIITSNPPPHKKKHHKKHHKGHHHH